MSDLGRGLIKIVSKDYTVRRYNFAFYEPEAKKFWMIFGVTEGACFIKMSLSLAR